MSLRRGIGLLWLWGAARGAGAGRPSVGAAVVVATLLMSSTNRSNRYAGVVRTGGGLGVVLDGERGHVQALRPSTTPSFRATCETRTRPNRPAS